MDPIIEYQLCLTHYKYLLTCELSKQYSLDITTVLKELLPEYKTKSLDKPKPPVVKIMHRKTPIVGNKSTPIVGNKPTIVKVMHRKTPIVGNKSTIVTKKDGYPIQSTFMPE